MPAEDLKGMSAADRAPSRDLIGLDLDQMADVPED